MPSHRRSFWPALAAGLWGEATDDLNLTRFSRGPPERGGLSCQHRTPFALVLVAGSGTIVIDDEAHDVRTGQAVVVPKGARQLTAGPQLLLRR